METERKKTKNQQYVIKSKFTIHTRHSKNQTLSK